MSDQQNNPSLFGYWLNCLKNNYANFEGRARRTEFWGYFLFNFIFSLALCLFAMVISIAGVAAGSAIISVFGWLLYSAWCLGIIVPGIAVNARRLHDTGKSGWMQLLYIIPCVGIVLFIIWNCTEGNAESNEYGPNPKA